MLDAAAAVESVANNDLHVLRGAIAPRIPRTHAKQVTAVRIATCIPAVAGKEVEPERTAAIRRRLSENATLGRQVLLRTRRVMLDRRDRQHRVGPEHVIAKHDTPGRDVNQHECEPVDVVRRRQVGTIAKPTPKRLPVGDPDAHVDAAGEATLVEPLARRPQHRDVRRAPPPACFSRRVEADLVNERAEPVDVRAELSVAPERIDVQPPAVRKKQELAQMQVPGCQPGPANHLPRDDALPGSNGRIHVPVTKVADVNMAANPAGRRRRHDAALDRVDTVRPAAGSATFGLIIANGNVDPFVVDRAALVIRARVEKRAPDGMLPANGGERPAKVRIVVALLHRKLARRVRRHRPTMADRSLRRRSSFVAATDGRPVGKHLGAGAEADASLAFVSAICGLENQWDVTAKNDREAEKECALPRTRRSAMGMTEVWNFRDDALARIDLRGFDVRARDGAIGKVVQAIEGSAGGYLVVDPGVAMPLGRQLLVPAGLVEKVDVENKRVVVRADRKQLENAPEYDPAQPLEDPAESAFGSYFRSLMEQLTGQPTRQRTPMKSRRTSTRASASQGKSRANGSGRSQSRSRTRRASDETTKEELYEQAKKLDIEGRSKMNKPELARAVGRRRGKATVRSSSAKANPVEVQAFLEGVGYPTRKRQLLREAESQNASRDVRATLRRLPEKSFKSPTEVSKAIGKLA